MTQRRIYQCAHPYFITFNVLNREWIFDDVKKAEMLHAIILSAGELKNYLVYQFCIMPDHVHILCQTVPHRGAEVSYRGLENPQYNTGGVCSVDFPIRDDNRDDVTRDDKNIKCDCGFVHKHTISDFIKSIRGTFSRYMQKGQIWHPRFYDQIIENDDRLRAAIGYITYNPIKAGLPKKYQKHPYQFKNDDLIARLF